jgi:heme-degrading monooxygenase HmoA
MTHFSKTPEPPYYAVVFTSQLSPDPDQYEDAAQRMVELAERMPGYLGIESTRGADGFGITVSYWASEADIANWRDHLQHKAVQEQGKRRWYQHYELRVARVERAYSGPVGR